MPFRLPYNDDPEHPDNWAAPSDDPQVRADVTFSHDTTKEKARAAMLKLQFLLDADPKGAKIKRTFVY